MKNDNLRIKVRAVTALILGLAALLLCLEGVHRYRRAPKPEDPMTVQANDQVTLTVDAFRVLATGGPLSSMLDHALQDNATNIGFSGDSARRYWCTNYADLRRIAGTGVSVNRAGKALTLPPQQE